MCFITKTKSLQKPLLSSPLVHIASGNLSGLAQETSNRIKIGPSAHKVGLPDLISLVVMMRLPHFSSRRQRSLARLSGCSSCWSCSPRSRSSCSPGSRSSGPPRFLVSEVGWSDRGERCVQPGFWQRGPSCCCCCCCWPKWHCKWQEGRYCWCDSLCATFGWCSFPWPPGASKARPKVRPWGRFFLQIARFLKSHLVFLKIAHLTFPKRLHSAFVNNMNDALLSNE